ncbi:MAG TPA: galactose oxidase early set domain-containing protein [Gemmatimonadales bacterium]
MRHRRAFAFSRLSVSLCAVSLLVLAACGEAPDTSGAPRVGGAPEGKEVPGPIRLSYVCGNRFLITSAYTVPVSITYRVLDSEEEGVASLSAAPPADPAFSERLIETRTRGAVQIFLDGRPIASRDNEAVPCSPATPAPAFLTASSSTAGEWTAPFDWPIVAVHLSLLPTGKVLSFGKAGTPQLWDPQTGVFSSVPSPVWLFCAGHALLPDGRVLVAGGHISDDHGLPDITLFSSTAGTWSSGSPMVKGRWYPTTTTMGSGEVVILAGRDEAGNEVTIPEVWKNGALRQLTGAGFQLAYYPRSFLAPNGKIFVAGEQQTSRFLTISGAGSWKNSAVRKFGVRDYGAAVMYDDGKILYVGGGHTTNTAEIIDLNQSPPKWQWTGSMAFARRHLNATVLPTGDVLVTGGVSGTGFNDLNTGVTAAELWSPSTSQWVTLASSIVTRGYHATSILLPDGRVLHTGSGDGATDPRQLNAEIFSPPYLFAGTRPTIGSAPVTVRYGTTFAVQSADAASIDKVSLIRLGSTTHSFDMNQRYRTLPFTKSGTTLTVTAPTVRNRTPPGHYMLFLVTSAGVPSVAKIVRIK